MKWSERSVLLFAVTLMLVLNVDSCRSKQLLRERLVEFQVQNSDMYRFWSRFRDLVDNERDISVTHQDIGEENRPSRSIILKTPDGRWFAFHPDGLTITYGYTR